MNFICNRIFLLSIVFIVAAHGIGQQNNFRWHLSYECKERMEKNI